VLSALLAIGFVVNEVMVSNLGDVNGDSHVDVGDIMAIINIMASSPSSLPQ